MRTAGRDGILAPKPGDETANTQMTRLQPVILSGGSGSRLWPLSREHYPKQLLAPFGDDSLLQATAARLAGLEGRSDALEVLPGLVICNEEHRFLVAEQLRAAGHEPGGILLEPVGRNTAPAVTLAALRAASEDERTVLLVMPADHLIADLEAFQRAVVAAARLADDGAVVTFGIVPTHAETGYGYIQRGATLPPVAGVSAHAIERFVEKPDRETAEGYLAAGDYLWNSGLFVVSAASWLSAIGRLQPAMLSACRTAYEAGRADGPFYRLDAGAFTACPEDSIDYAVMEPLAAEDGGRTAVIPLDAGWSDVGAWSSLWDVMPHDVQGNLLRGDVLAEDTEDSLLIAESRLLATIGLRDVVVIETPDAVLVTDRSRAQDVRRIVDRLKSEGRSEYRIHRRVYRPWGDYEGIDAGHRYQVKRITVQPGASLSLQMHHHRAEHWVVVSGTARVTRGEETFMLSENESTYIPIGVTHRLENPGKLPLEIIEVQSGAYLGEDDIVRFEDDYGRTEA